MIVPVGGLANRMRAVASGMALAKDAGREAGVAWMTDWALNAPFHRLFEPLPASMGSCCVEDVRGWAKRCLLDRPRRKNLYLPRLFQKLMFRSCLYEERMAERIRSHFDFLDWARRGGGYVASCYTFYPYPDGAVKELFVPLPEIREEVERRVSAFSAHTIGVHVRRTDNVASIKESPLELFYEQIDRERAAHADLKVYLATDSEEVKRQMRLRYGDMILLASQQARRDSVEGIKDGVAEMYTLARTRRIYGSYGSSYSEMAAEIGRVPLVVVRRPC